MKKQILITLEENNTLTLSMTEGTTNNDIIQGLILLFEYFDAKTKKNIIDYLTKSSKNEKDTIYFN